MIRQLVQRGRTAVRRHPLARLDHEDGQGLVEYSLIIGLIAIVVAAAVGGVGTALINLYGTFPGAF